MNYQRVRKSKKLGDVEGQQLGKWMNEKYNAAGLERDKAAHLEAVAKRTAKEAADASTTTDTTTN